MKFMKADGTVEDGTPFTEEQARIVEVVHELVCRHRTHYSWQGVPECSQVAIRVGEGISLLDALSPKPEPEPEPLPAVPEPVAVAVEKDEVMF
jgi:hypothetical protein